LYVFAYKKARALVRKGLRAEDGATLSFLFPAIPGLPVRLWRLGSPGVGRVIATYSFFSVPENHTLTSSFLVCMIPKIMNQWYRLSIQGKFVPHAGGGLVE